MTAAAGRRKAPHSPLATAPLTEADPEVFASVEREVRRQQQEIELIASENFVVPRRAGGRRHRTYQQVCRGLSRPSLLRWLPVCR